MPALLYSLLVFIDFLIVSNVHFLFPFADIRLHRQHIVTIITKIPLKQTIQFRLPFSVFLFFRFHQICEYLRLDKFSLYFVFHAFQTRRMNILHCIHIAVCITILQRHFANANLSGFQVQNALRFLITYRRSKYDFSNVVIFSPLSDFLVLFFSFLFSNYIPQHER